MCVKKPCHENFMCYYLFHLNADATDHFVIADLRGFLFAIIRGAAHLRVSAFQSFFTVLITHRSVLIIILLCVNPIVMRVLRVLICLIPCGLLLIGLWRAGIFHIAG